MPVATKGGSVRVFIFIPQKLTVGTKPVKTGTSGLEPELWVFFEN
jgi:hypothetical protein